MEVYLAKCSFNPKELTAIKNQIATRASTTRIEDGGDRRDEREQAAAGSGTRSVPTSPGTGRVKVILGQCTSVKQQHMPSACRVLPVSDKWQPEEREFVKSCAITKSVSEKNSPIRGLLEKSHSEPTVFPKSSSIISGQSASVSVCSKSENHLVELSKSSNEGTSRGMMDVCGALLAFDKGDQLKVSLMQYFNINSIQITTNEF